VGLDSSIARAFRAGAALGRAIIAYPADVMLSHEAALCTVRSVAAAANIMDHVRSAETGFPQSQSK